MSFTECSRCGPTERSVQWSEAEQEHLCSRCFFPQDKRGGARVLPSAGQNDEEVIDAEVVEQQQRPDGAYTRSLADVNMEPVKWLWPGRIPLGMLSMLAGDPGLGKSLLTMQMAAKVSRAGLDSILLTAEDHESYTIKPRAVAAGADLDRIHVAKQSRYGMDEGLRLPDDADKLDLLVAEHNAKLVVIDPLMAHMAEAVNSWSDKSTRSALAPIHHMAERRGCAVVFVLHLNKAKGADPTYRTGGSIAVPAAVRSALLLARDPEDPDGDRGRQRVLAHFKCNVAEFAESLTYEIGTVALGDDLLAPRLKQIGTSETSGADLLSLPNPEERSQRSDAVDFLVAELAGGTPVSAREVQASAREAGISPRTLERAKATLGVISKKEGFAPAEWVWQLPEDRQHEDRHPHTPPVAVFGENGSGKPNGNSPDSEDRQPVGIGGVGVEAVVQEFSAEPVD